MRKNLKIILLLLSIMAAMCIFAGCGDGKQDNQSTKQSADTNNDEEQANSGEQENNTGDGQDGAKQDQPEGEVSDKPMNAVGSQAADNKSVDDESADRHSNAPASDGYGMSTGRSDELSVDVESVGDNSVVGNKISIESGIDGNSEIMTIGVGEDNKVLVTVYFAENASYVYKTIRNGGADVETRDGSFSDIKKGMTLHLTGYYKGEDFCADKVVISDVIID